MESVERAGISMKTVTAALLDEGLRQFVDAFAQLMKAPDRGKARNPQRRSISVSYTLPAKLSAAVDSALTDWAKNDKMRRLWRADASLWSGADENHWLGWLGITDDQVAHSAALTSLAAEIKQAGFKHALLLGMEVRAFVRKSCGLPSQDRRISRAACSRLH